MSSRDDKKKKKEKDKEKDTESFDGNIETDSVRSTPSTSTRSGNSGQHSSGSSVKQTTTGSDQGASTSTESDMIKLAKVLQSGFKSVTDTISTKLNDVGDRFTDSINDMHDKLDNRLTELASPPDHSSPQYGGGSEEDDMDWDNHSGRFDYREDRQSTHAMSDSSSQAGKNESFFKKKNQPPPEERVGEVVDQDLAEIADRCFKKPMTEDQFKTKIQDKYLRPKNVEWIRTPEIPFSIYRRLSSDFKNTDKPLKFVQDQLVPVACSLVGALDKLGSGDLNGGMEILSDTLEGFGYVFRTNLTEKRRLLLKPKLPEDYKQLVSEKCAPSPTNLLGDISENTKKISETDKITMQMDKSSKGAKDKSKQSSGNRGKPYSRQSSSSSRRGGGGGFFNRRFDNYRRTSGRQDYGSSGNYGSNRTGSDYRSSNFRRGGQQKK